MSTGKEIGTLIKDVIKSPALAFKHHPLGTSLFAVAVVLFFGIATYRFKYGLGVTGINDATAWGIWTAFKLSLVVFSGCAFGLTCMVYIFKMERFRPFVRAAALIGFLGYSTFAVTLILELGWPWRIVHPIVMHNYNSILFEVAICVMTYLTILLLEILPNFLDRIRAKGLAKTFKIITPIFVVIGIVLSVLHQSSLGSLFVMAPYKMNLLWWSPWVGPFFIMSAIFCGLSMIIVCELGMAYFDKRAPRLTLIADLAKYSGPFLGLYFGFKIAEIVERAGAREAFAAFDIYTLLWVIEIGLGILVPAILFGNPNVRKSPMRVGIPAAMVLLFGGALNRLNVSVIALDHSPLGYSPTFVEYLYIPTMLVLLPGVFIIITRFLPILGPVTSLTDPKEVYQDPFH
jgi:Ni/Fe-hydrogenase subunit HybB-like protein